MIAALRRNPGMTWVNHFSKCDSAAGISCLQSPKASSKVASSFTLSSCVPVLSAKALSKTTRNVPRCHSPYPLRGDRPHRLCR